MAENYYDILGVPENASCDEIKMAFRKLALLYHPDKNPHTKELFIKVLQAYEVLSNPELRKKYDRGLLSASPATSQNYSHRKKEKRKRWEVSEEEEKRRWYYKNYFEKLKREYEQEKQKYEHQTIMYNEWKYWLWAIFICFILFVMVIFVYKK